MEPKEKAAELFSEYHYHICNDNGISENGSTEICARNCSITAVKELIKAIPVSVPGIGYGNAMFVNPDVRYWQEVLTELNQL